MVLHPRSRPYTAFTVPGQGQFEWTCSPQGCLGAPASFQRLMETVVRGLSKVIVYIDNLLLHLENHHSHLELLDQVLRCLVQNGIKMNLEKCVFGSKKVSYLGFQLTEEGIKPMIDKMKAVALAAPPNLVREVRQSFCADFGSPHCTHKKRLSMEGWRYAFRCFKKFQRTSKLSGVGASHGLSQKKPQLHAYHQCESWR